MFHIKVFAELFPPPLPPKLGIVIVPAVSPNDHWLYGCNNSSNPNPGEVRAPSTPIWVMARALACFACPGLDQSSCEEGGVTAPPVKCVNAPQKKGDKTETQQIHHSTIFLGNEQL